MDSIDEGLYEVTFLDYGNKVVVGLDNMVATAADIPSDEMEMVDYMVNVASPDRVEETLGRRKRRSVTVTSRLKPRKSRRLRSTNGEVLTTRLSRIIPPPLLAKTLSPLQECCARWRDGNWYRARFIKYLDKEHQRCFVVLVDYGNIYQVGVENIRCQIYGQRIPIQCLTAVLTGVEPVGGAWSQECLDHIQHRTRWVRWWTASLKM